MDLTALAREGMLDPVAGRDDETARALQILVRRRKSNPCFIGEPGVGKTAIAEAIAMRVASGVRFLCAGFLIWLAGWLAGWLVIVLVGLRRE